MNAAIEQSSREEILRRKILVERELLRRQTERKLDWYVPYPKQREFIEAGSKFREYAMFGSNQTGKSQTLGFFIAVHATGLYPEKGSPYGEWQGHRYSKPPRILVVGNDLSQMVGAIQAKLVGFPMEWERGEDGQWSSGGFIPGECIHDISRNSKPPFSIGLLFVKWSGGGYSLIKLVSQEQAETSIMGWPFDLIVWDEMPQKTSMYTQAISRTIATRGHFVTGATAETGYNEIIDRFVGENAYDNWYTKIGLRDADHITEEDIREIRRQFPEWMWPVKVEGDVFYGSGRIYPFNFDQVGVEAFRIPHSWPRKIGMDFGGSKKAGASPTAVTFVAIDPGTDMHYVYKAFYVFGIEGDPTDVAYMIRAHDENLKAGYRTPVFWPHDGNFEERSTGNMIAETYLELGLNMYDEPSYMIGVDGKKSNNVLSSVLHVYRQFKQGRLKIFGRKGESGNLEPTEDTRIIWNEMLKYSRSPEGKILKMHDHCLDALRYEEMMSDDYAESPERGRMDQRMYMPLSNFARGN